MCSGLSQKRRTAGENQFLSRDLDDWVKTRSGSSFVDVNSHTTFLARIPPGREEKRKEKRKCAVCNLVAFALTYLSLHLYFCI